MVFAFGAPVIEAQGNSARKISARGLHCEPLHKFQRGTQAKAQEGKVVLVTGLKGLIECRRRFVADKTGGVELLFLDALVQVVDGRYDLVQGVDFDLFNQLVEALPLARFGIIENSE
jgi:hypothetical protein